MELELATLYDIAEELSKRGLQFIIFIEKTKVDNGNGELHACVDANKDLQELAKVLAPYFGMTTADED